MPLHLRQFCMLARRYPSREQPLAATFTSIYLRDEPLPVPCNCATYRACLAGAHRGKGGWSVTCPANSFLGGRQPIGTCPGSHWVIRIRTAVLRSSRRCFSLGKKVVGLIDHCSTHSRFASFTIYPVFFLMPTGSLLIRFNCMIPLFRIEANRIGARTSFTMCLDDFLIDVPRSPGV